MTTKSKEKHFKNIAEKLKLKNLNESRDIPYSWIGRFSFTKW